MDPVDGTITNLAALLSAAASMTVTNGVGARGGSDDAWGIGVDVEPIDRWAVPDVRVFTDGERRHCDAGSGVDRSARYAGRWCAKEAVLKAFSGREEISLRDIEVLAGPRGEPHVVLAARLVDRGWNARVSIAHDRVHAVAVAVAGR